MSNREKINGYLTGRTKMSEKKILIIDDDIRICRIIKNVADNLNIKSFATDNSK